MYFSTDFHEGEDIQSMLVPWRVVKSVVSLHDRWLKVRTDSCLTDSGRTIEPYHVIEYPPWINVIALTAEKQIVLVRQYRHGAEEIVTGIPCGVVDQSDPSPAHAAVRELSEETGYEGDPPRLTGTFYANPANQNNMVSSFLILNARRTRKQTLDPNEDIEVVLMNLRDFLRSAIIGEIKLQGMHNSALLLALPYLLDEIGDSSIKDIFALPDGDPIQGETQKPEQDI